MKVKAFLIFVASLFAAQTYGQPTNAQHHTYAQHANAQRDEQFCFRYPMRVINGQKIDLHPLFAHWLTKTNAVTNSNWLRITGTIVKESGGWIVDGQTTSASGLKTRQNYLVLNPPRAEKQLYEQLSAEAWELQGRNTALNNQVNGNTSKEDDAGFTMRVREAEGLNASAAGNTVVTLGHQSSGMMQQMYANGYRLDEIRQQLELIPRTHTPNGEVYKVDFFVLYTGTVQNGLVVLDFGTPTQ